MKWFFAFTAVCALHATQSSPPFDADLFKRDTQVFSMQAEFLFWQIQEGGLDYALKMDTQSWGPAYNYAQGQFINQAWNGEPGFRVGARYFRAPHFWEIWWEYTRMTGRGSSHVNAPSNPVQYLTGTWPQIISVMANAKSNIHMNYNVFDMMIDRFFNPNPHLRLRFLGGGSVAWMNQLWAVYYSDIFHNTTVTRNSWDFIGGGFKMGSMIDWYWGWGCFYWTVKTLMGGFLGSYHNYAKQYTNYPEASSNPGIPFRNSHYSDVRPAFTFQFIIGPSWQKNTAKNRFELFAGWEINGWLNLHELYRSSGGSPSGPKETYINTSMLALQGLTTRFSMDF